MYINFWFVEAPFKVALNVINYVRKCTTGSRVALREMYISET